MFKYNSQRDNFNFNGQFMGWSQCFSTCAWMFISYYIDAIDGADDQGLKIYVDEVEQKVGSRGLGESIASTYNIKGHSSLYWVVQKAGIEKYFQDYGCNVALKYIENGRTVNDLIGVLKKGNIAILGTNKIGGLESGHIVLVTNYFEHSNGSHFEVYDPFGNATTNYQDHDGEAVLYPYEYLIEHAQMCNYLLKGKVRFLSL